MPKHEHLYAGREFVMEGDKVPSGRMQGILLTQGNRHQIGKGHFDKDDGCPVITWENGSGKCEKKFVNVFLMSKFYPDATHLVIPADDDEQEIVMQMKFDFL